MIASVADLKVGDYAYPDDGNRSYLVERVEKVREGKFRYSVTYKGKGTRHYLPGDTVKRKKRLRRLAPTMRLRKILRKIPR